MIGPPGAAPDVIFGVMDRFGFVGGFAGDPGALGAGGAPIGPSTVGEIAFGEAGEGPGFGGAPGAFGEFALPEVLLGGNAGGGEGPAGLLGVFTPGAAGPEDEFMFDGLEADGTDGFTPTPMLIGKLDIGGRLGDSAGAAGFDGEAEFAGGPDGAWASTAGAADESLTFAALGWPAGFDAGGNGSIARGEAGFFGSIGLPALRRTCF